MAFPEFDAVEKERISSNVLTRLLCIVRKPAASPPSVFPRQFPCLYAGGGWGVSIIERISVWSNINVGRDPEPKAWGIPGTLGKLSGCGVPGMVCVGRAQIGACSADLS